MAVGSCHVMGNHEAMIVEMWSRNSTASDTSCVPLPCAMVQCL
jgi:hypothetical protein